MAIRSISSRVIYSLVRLSSFVIVWKWASVSGIDLGVRVEPRPGRAPVPRPGIAVPQHTSRGRAGGIIPRR